VSTSKRSACSLRQDILCNMVQHLVLNNNSQGCRLMSKALSFASPSESNLPYLLRTISLFGCCALKNYFCVYIQILQWIQFFNDLIC